VLYLRANRYADRTTWDRAWRRYPPRQPLYLLVGVRYVGLTPTSFRVKHRFALNSVPVENVPERQGSIHDVVISGEAALCIAQGAANLGSSRRTSSHRMVDGEKYDGTNY
jgi:hypothetical protein